MTFQEKSALIMTGILVVVFGWYFTLVLGPISSSPAREFAYTGLMVAVVILLTVLAVVSHVALVIIFHSQANAHDERDRLIGMRSAGIASYILAVGICLGIWLAMIQTATFWIAQALIGTLVIAEIADGLIKLMLYRREA